MGVDAFKRYGLERRRRHAGDGFTVLDPVNRRQPTPMPPAESFQEQVPLHRRHDMKARRLFDSECAHAADQCNGSA
jgi:hypothetical protein